MIEIRLNDNRSIKHLIQCRLPIWQQICSNRMRNDSADGIQVFSVPEVWMGIEIRSMIAAATSSAETGSTSTDEFTVNFVFDDTVTVRQSCALLSFLIVQSQVSPDVKQILRQHIRKCLIPSIIEAVEERLLAETSTQQLNAFFEEILLARPARLLNQDLQDLVVRATHAIGCLLQGVWGVRVDELCRDLVDVLFHVAPYLFSPVSMDEAVEGEELQSQKYFVTMDMSDYLDFSATTTLTNSNHRAGSVEENFTDPPSRLSNFFSNLRQYAEEGKIVVVVVDNMNHFLGTGNEIKREALLRHWEDEIAQCDFELMIFAGSNRLIGRTRLLDLLWPLSVYLPALPQAFQFFLHAFFNNLQSAASQQFLPEIDGISSRSVEHYEDGERRWKDALLRQLQLNAENFDPFLISFLHNFDFQGLKALAKNAIRHLIHSHPTPSSYFFIPSSDQQVDCPPVKLLHECLIHAFDAFHSSQHGSLPTSPNMGSPHFASIGWLNHGVSVPDASQQKIDHVVQAIRKSFSQFGCNIHLVQLTEDNQLSSPSDHSAADSHSPSSIIIHKVSRRLQSAFLRRLHTEFMFRSSEWIDAPHSIVPLDMRHAPMPGHAAANPLSYHFRQSKNSLYVIPCLDTLVGYHEELRSGVAQIIGSGISTSQETSHGRGLGASVGGGVEIGTSSGIASSSGTGSIETIISGSSKGGSAAATLAWLVFPSGKLGAETGSFWENIIGRTLSSVLSRSLSWAPKIHASYDRVMSESSSRGRGSGTNKHTAEHLLNGISKTFKHSNVLLQLVHHLRLINQLTYAQKYASGNQVVVFFRNQVCADEVVQQKMGYHSLLDFQSFRHGCSHGSRNCKLFAECCNKWVDCVKCHDAHESNAHSMVGYVKWLFSFSHSQYPQCSRD